jgi:psp operon transcriptional activator
VDFEAAVAQFETGLLRRALEEARFNQKRAAELLGLSYHQLRGLLRKYRLLDAEAAQPEMPNSAGTRA